MGMGVVNHTRKSNDVIYGEGLWVIRYLSTSKMTGHRSVAQVYVIEPQ